MKTREPYIKTLVKGITVMCKSCFGIGFILSFLSISPALFSQNVGINTSGTTPSVNAILDLNTGNAGNLGFIIPNVTLGLSLSTFNPPIAHAATAADNGMMVYNSVTTNQPLGYYYWNSTLNSWVSVGGSGGGGLSSCGTAAINYIPYFTSATAICNSVLYQGSTTTLGIGTATPKNMLDVNGAIAIGSYAGVNTAPAGTSMIASGQLGVGINSPNTAALLDLTSITMGLLTPRMTTAQIAAIANPAIGLLVYNTSTNCFEFNSTGTTTGWSDIACPCNIAPTIGTITGSSLICTNQTYTISSVTNATYYAWSSSNTNIAFLSSANGGTSATFTGGATTGYVTLTAIAGNNCGSSSTTTTVWNGIPPNATTPVGNESPPISATSTYTCAAVPNATTYTWSINSTDLGITLASGQGTQTVTVSFDATPSAANICVTASNACGSSSPACLPVYSITCPSYTLTTVPFTFNGGTEQTGTVQTWTVPSCVNTITVTVVGGGATASIGSGGKAASITGTILVTPGDVLDILVAGYGSVASADFGSGGGGGSFVWDATTNNLLAAAGGGGGATALGTTAGNGQITYTSLAALETPGTAAGVNNGAGGTGGNAGGEGISNIGGYDSYEGGGGAGWLTSATTSGWLTNYTAYCPACGSPPGYGATGGNNTGLCAGTAGPGGFGGGGGGQFNAGGGGGGYNGGGGGGNSGNGCLNAESTGNAGGGGGSYWQSVSQIISATNIASGSTNGSVTIIYN